MPSKKVIRKDMEEMHTAEQNMQYEKPHTVQFQLYDIWEKAKL